MGLSSEIEKIKNQSIQEQFNELSSSPKGLASTDATQRLKNMAIMKLPKRILVQLRNSLAISMVQSH